MIRKQIRQRKEYLYKKARENQDSERYDAKKNLRTAIKDSGFIPSKTTDLENQATDSYFDFPVANNCDVRDDEYATAGLKDPKVLITTSRDPSSRLQQFAKEMRLVFPNAQRINRGNHVLSEIVDVCRGNGITDLILIHEHRGNPDCLVISHFPHGPTIYFSLHNVVLRHDIKDETKQHVSEAYPHLIFHGLTSELGIRIKMILKYLFPVPKDDSHRIMTFSNQSDFISFR